MRCATARVSSLVLAATACVLCLPILAEEPVGVSAFGTGGLQPQIVGRLSEEQARTYGTTAGTALALSAEGFSPNDSSTTYTFSTLNGGQYITGGHPFLDHSVDLPEGSQVVSIELDGCDNDNAGHITMWFSKCSVGGPCADLNSLGTDDAATPGCGRFPLTLVSPVTIDNFNNSYFTYFSTSGAGNASVFSIRIYYKLQVSPAPATATFADVPTNFIYFRAIEALAASGITSGCGGGNFCPNQNVTRGELAKFLANALGLHHAP